MSVAILLLWFAGLVLASFTYPDRPATVVEVMQLIAFTLLGVILSVLLSRFLDVRPTPGDE